MILSKIKIFPCKLNGTISVPPSKSAAHRAIICASLAKGKSVIEPVEQSDDIKATIECMTALGADISVDGKTLTVDGTNTFKASSSVLNCRESGSTLRFLVPVAAAGSVSAEFVGRGRLPQRPIGIYLDCLPQKGVRCISSGGLPLKISGRLKSGTYKIPGNISSQFITGLLLSLPLLDGDSEIVLTSPAQSVGYINMTLDIMKKFGVNVETAPDGWKIKGGQSYAAGNFAVEGDWSQAAFFMTAAAIDGKITIDNLNLESRQGDRECMDIYSKFGADIAVNKDGSITISRGELHGIEINALNIPDMVPALAVTAAFAKGTTVIKGAARLRLKESDRLAAMCDGLSRLGADIKETDDGLIINGADFLHGGTVNGYNDHRVVMSLAAASAGCNGEIIISDMESINKSYPSYFKDFEMLGGKTDVIMG